MTNLVVEAKRVNQKVRFDGVSESHPEIVIPMDYTPPLGNGEGLAGLETLLISFAGCVSTAVVGLLQRAKKQIADYAMRVEGIRREQPLSLQEIQARIRVKSPDITAADMDGILKYAEAISPVWLAIKNNVAVQITYEITQ